ncbi:MAG: aspartate carbamoyltransferase catalytic subunit [bacterium]|nr:aspartate carbamoyltransferase catalytic subunit [bacterium]
MQNFTDIKKVETTEIEEILKLANDFEQNKAQSSCAGKHIALFFMEPSTRTRFSFEMAANKLNLHKYQFSSSTLAKGESLKDAIENLYQLGISCVVLRHQQAGIFDSLINEINCPMHFINAGDGNHTHPTQAMLDLYTMNKILGSVKGKKISIIGDIKHSRVAHANVTLLKKFGADIWICAPDYFKDEIKDVTITRNLKDALKDASVAMTLRVQKERLEDRIPIFDYIHDYGITMKKLQEYAPKDVILMHPGPVNRDVEIASDVLDSQYGQTILDQAHNGVFVRMAIIDTLLR